MTRLFSVRGRDGHSRGFLSMYLLCTLKRKPKSGYEILSEINERCDGSWAPSKGTIYPLLDRLREEGLISVKSVGARSKNVYEVTAKGRKAIARHRAEKERMHERFAQLRNLFSEIIGVDDAKILGLIHEIRWESLNAARKEKEKTVRTLEECLKELKGGR